MKKSILMIVIATVIASCSTYEKKLAKSTKFFKDNPVELAKICVERFPTVTKLIPGKTDTVAGQTIFVKGDSIPCPDGTKAKAPDRKVTCPPSTFRVDTLRFEDTAKLFIVQDELRASGDTVLLYKERLSNSNKKLAEAEKSSQKRLWIIIGMGVLMAGGIAAKIKGLI